MEGNVLEVSIQGVSIQGMSLRRGEYPEVNTGGKYLSGYSVGVGTWDEYSGVVLRAVSIQSKREYPEGLVLPRGSVLIPFPSTTSSVSYWNTFLFIINCVFFSLSEFFQKTLYPMTILHPFSI